VAVREGESEGADVGVREGESEGADVGASEGENEGEVVGCWMGLLVVVVLAEWPWLALTDKAVGVAVGVTEGAEVSIAVGRLVRSASALNATCTRST
jgi:hypothetical protein